MQHLTRNRLIDGWRGLSIALVIGGHLIGSRYAAQFVLVPFRDLLAPATFDAGALLKGVVLRIVQDLPTLGVDIFFVISGYLITALLIREDNERGTISIRAFYVRRVFRILPAFYVFLLTSFVLAKTGALSITDGEFASAALFYSNTKWAHGTWWLGHTWSLSVEEQFYILWPLMFSLLGRALRTKGLLLVVALLLVLSALDALTVGWLNNATAFACIVMGALYAASGRVAGVVNRWRTVGPMAIAIVLLLLQPFFASVPLAYKAIELVKPFMVMFVVFGTVNGKGLLVGTVSNELMRRIGLISFSLYLWQELFTAAPESYAPDSPLRFPLLMLPCALLSYALIERPMIKIGRRISAAIIGASAPVTNPIPERARLIG